MPGLGSINTKKHSYKLVRSNRKTLSIEVNINAQLIVRSPKKLSLDDIEKYINDKYDWIQSKVRLAQLNIPHKHNYVINEKFLYLGNLYPLTTSKQKQNLTFDGHSFRNSEAGKSDFLKWYKKEFTNIAVPRLYYYAETYQLEFNQVRVKAQKTLWGSCSSKNNINLNYLLMMAPMSVIDYVIVHELSHTVHKNHSLKFWNLVSYIFPDYKASIYWLKENGYKLHSL
jgi:hypothetical protein